MWAEQRKTAGNSGGLRGTAGDGGRRHCLGIERAVATLPQAPAFIKQESGPLFIPVTCDCGPNGGD